MDTQRRTLITVFKIIDVLILIGWLVVLVATANLTRFDALLSFFNLEISMTHILLGVGYLVLCTIVFSAYKLYHSRRLSTVGAEIIDIVLAFSLCSIVLAAIARIFNISLIGNQFSILFWIATCITAVLSRIVLRFVLKQIRLKGRNLRNILIVGTNKDAIEFARKIEALPELGYRLAGFVDEPWEGMAEFKASGHAIVSDFAGFQSYLRDNIIDDVSIFLPMKSFYSEASKVLGICEEQGVVFRNRAKVFDSKIAQSQINCFQGDYLTTHFTGAMNGWRTWIKRSLDILISGSGLVLLAPLFLTVTLLIKMTSKGPAFFIQDRLGFNKRIFRLFKFRTMVADAEKQMAEIERYNEVSGPVFKIKNDPRITPIGKFLRKSSIDELPQLINVFIGDMSIVGPRPLPVRDYKGFKKDWHRRRFSVKPGITCLWQVNGRNSITFEKWMELDMHYIDRWSLLLDLKILIKTVPAVFKGSGAA